MTKTQQIAEGWNSYAYSNGLKPGTKKYQEFQHAYVNGAHAVLMEETPPIITIYLMTGRDIGELAREVSA